jgi:hypothetical protein
MVAAGGAASDLVCPVVFRSDSKATRISVFRSRSSSLSAHYPFFSPYINGRGGLTDDDYGCTVHDNLPDRATASLPFLPGCSGICNATPPACLSRRVHDASPVVSALIFLRQTSLLQSNTLANPRRSFHHVRVESLDDDAAGHSPEALVSSS